MTMKKKLLTTLSVVLILGLAALGILAYLTDTDSDVNVMTLGNVQIDQIEEFEQGADLYPGVKVTKEVSVKNVGESPAYVRTLVAFETIDDWPGYEPEWNSAVNADKLGVQIDVGGVKYDVWEVVYDNAVESGKETAKSLMSVKLHEACTNEHMEALGGEYEVLVLSQAVQTEGFTNAEVALDTAFGNVSATMATVWFSGDSNEIEVTPGNAQEVLDEIGNGMTIKLTTGNYGVLNITPVEGGATTELDSTTGYLSRSINGLTIKGAADVKVDGIKVAVDGGNTISLNNIVIDGVDFTGVAEGFVCTPKKATIKNFTMQNCTMTSGGGKDLVKLRWPENVTVTNCKVDGAARLLTTAGAKNVTVTNNTINNVTKVGILISDEFDGLINSGTIVIRDNVYTGTNNTARLIRCANVDDAKLIITDNQATGYYAATGSDKDYIKITTKDASVTPDVTITGNKYSYADQKLHISVNGVEYKQSTPDTL